ncbi:MAG TPA: pyridoxamine 5'-phosphate oxidase family protein [Nocardioidaceae bacterium]
MSDTGPGNGWPPRRLEELARAECVRLLGSKSVGRVAFVAEGSPVVLPVNYVSSDGMVYFRTSTHNVMAAHLLDAAAAFQVDDVDEFMESGWSVLVQGWAEFLDPEVETEYGLERLAHRIEPWAAGARYLLVRIKPERISGRRLEPR